MIILMLKNFINSLQFIFRSFLMKYYVLSKGFSEGEGPDLLSDTPPVPPRRREKKRHTPPRPVSNGLPPTPKVHMGACFSKVIIFIKEL
jgi:hypothetical protein